MSVRETTMDQDRRILVIEPGTSGRNLAEFVRTHKDGIEERLLEHGALLFRDFDVASVADFNAFVEAVSQEKLDYVYGSTPRTALGNRIFTATEYPPAQEIPLHNENAYQREWPMKLSLCCLIPADSGGETPIADMRKVTPAVGSALLDKFEKRGVKYVRHYRPFTDVPWQKVFQTDDPAVVGRYCAEHGIEHEWLDDDTLRTTQVCQGVARHPRTGELVFFNQAHLFHVSSTGPEIAQSMIEIFGVDRLPRHTCYGDGEEISPEDLAAVRDAFNKASVSFPWRAGDVMLLDNMQFAHGRRPFTGTRKVLAALMDKCSAH